jgi:dihydrofolate synthase/folylpolyglutamate synthase
MFDTAGNDLRLMQVLARLDALVNWERSRRDRMRVGLGPVSDLLSRLGNPERHFRSIHVTGSKGKGSVCALLEAGLFEAGYCVGRYSSPHVDRINERVSHNRQAIEDVQLANSLEVALDAKDAADREATEGRDATWFDVLTVAAFHSFQVAKLDWAVIEVGLGGRLDSTNTITPEIAVITNVGLEHTDVLGDTTEKIAREKAGIIKAGIEAVTQVSLDEPPGRVISQVAQSKGALVVPVIVGEQATIEERNVAVAGAVLDRLALRNRSMGGHETPLGAQLLTDDVISSCVLPGRLERRRVRRSDDGTTVDVVIDGAHVAFAIEAVLRDLRSFVAYRRPPVVVLALAADKDAASIITSLARFGVDALLCTSLGRGKPFWTPISLAELGVQGGITSMALRSPEEAFRAALLKSGQAWILVIGSLHLAGQIRRLIDAPANW